MVFIFVSNMASPWAMPILPTDCVSVLGIKRPLAESSMSKMADRSGVRVLIPTLFCALSPAPHTIRAKKTKRYVISFFTQLISYVKHHNIQVSLIIGTRTIGKNNITKSGFCSNFLPSFYFNALRRTEVGSHRNRPANIIVVIWC